MKRLLMALRLLDHDGVDWTVVTLLVALVYPLFHISLDLAGLVALLGAVTAYQGKKLIRLRREKQVGEARSAEFQALESKLSDLQAQHQALASNHQELAEKVTTAHNRAAMRPTRL